MHPASVLCGGLGERIGTGNASSGCGLDDLAWQPICVVGAVICNPPLPQLSVGLAGKMITTTRSEPDRDTGSTAKRM